LAERRPLRFADVEQLARKLNLEPPITTGGTGSQDQNERLQPACGKNPL